jgi:glycosyltransferase involved in cell wall biosynthesis
MQCSVVIRAYNEAQHLERLLAGIKQQSLSDAEIVLVDSGSGDATVSIAQAHGARVVRIRPEDFTFGRSLNLGIGAASREYIVIASAHVYPVYPDWLESLLKPFADPLIGLAYGKQRAPAGARFSERQIFLQWYPDASRPRQQTAFCNNANAAIRRSLWEQNPYDESLTGLEDLAWAQWAQRQGHAIAYVAEAEVIHVHSESPLGVFNRHRREAMAFKRLHPEAHFSPYDFVRLTLTNIISDLWHATKEAGFWRNLPSILWFRFMQFRGTRRGYRDSSPLTSQLRETFYYPRDRRATQAAHRDVQPIPYDRG